MDRQRLAVAHIGQVGDELEVVNDLGARVVAALDAEGEDAAEAAGEVLLCELVRGVRFETEVGHPGDVVVALEPFRQCEGVLRVALGAETERFEAEDELLCGEGAHAGAHVAHNLQSALYDEGDGAEVVVELEAVEAGCWVVQVWEACGVLAPGKFA